MYKCVRGSLGGRESTSGKVRGMFGEGSGKVRKASGGATQGQAPDPPVGILYGSLIIPLLEPSSELAIREYYQSKAP